MGKCFIGALVKATDVSAPTIRYYEALGLLKPIRRTRGGFRVYDETAIPMLKFIRHAQRLGFSLKEVRQVLRAWQRTAYPCETVREIAKQKLTQIDALLKRLMALRERLQTLAQSPEALDNSKPFPPCICHLVMDTPPLDEPLLPLPPDWDKTHKRRKKQRKKRQTERIPGLETD